MDLSYSNFLSELEPFLSSNQSQLEPCFIVLFFLQTFLIQATRVYAASIVHKLEFIVLTVILTVILIEF